MFPLFHTPWFGFELTVIYNKLIYLDTHGVSTLLFHGSEKNNCQREVINGGIM